MKIFIALATSLALGACAVTPEDQAKACDQARDALAWARLSVIAACATGYVEACQTAQKAVEAAQASTDAMCPVGAPPAALTPIASTL